MLSGQNIKVPVLAVPFDTETESHGLKCRIGAACSVQACFAVVIVIAMNKDDLLCQLSSVQSVLLVWLSAWKRVQKRVTSLPYITYFSAEPCLDIDNNLVELKNDFLLEIRKFCPTRQKSKKKC